MPNVLLTESIAIELGATEPWPEGVRLFQQLEEEQILLPDRALSRAVQAYLKMCSLEFTLEERFNAEEMSPVSGQLPFIKAGPFVISEMNAIIEFVNKKGITLSSHLDSSQRADLKAHMTLVTNVFLSAELYISWCHQETLKNVTQPRFSFPYPWPLNRILFWGKKRSVRKQLESLGWLEKTIEDVLTEVESCCTALSERLDKSSYFYGEKPTELDALVYGHVSAITGTSLPDESLSGILEEYPKLIELRDRIHKTYF